MRNAIDAGMSIEDFIATFVDKDEMERRGVDVEKKEWFILKNADGKLNGTEYCVFLDPETNHCGVYSARPLQCSTYPWWPELLSSSEWREEGASVCEGIILDGEEAEVDHSKLTPDHEKKAKLDSARRPRPRPTRDRTPDSHSRYALRSFARFRTLSRRVPTQGPIQLTCYLVMFKSHSFSAASASVRFRGNARHPGSSHDLGTECGSNTRLQTLHWLTIGTNDTPLPADRIPLRDGVTFLLGAAMRIWTNRAFGRAGGGVRHVRGVKRARARAVEHPPCRRECPLAACGRQRRLGLQRSPSPPSELRVGTPVRGILAWRGQCPDRRTSVTPLFQFL